METIQQLRLCDCSPEDARLLLWAKDHFGRHMSAVRLPKTQSEYYVGVDDMGYVTGELLSPTAGLEAVPVVWVPDADTRHSGQLAANDNGSSYALLREDCDARHWDTIVAAR